jgi:hypothetical protein
MGAPAGETDHRHEVRLPLAAPVVAQILDARPTTWISSFLRISALWAGSGRPPAGPPWFRLGASQVEAGVLTSSLRWRPNVEGLFSSFAGRFVLSPAGDGCTFALEGTAVGGTAATNDRVLAALVDSLSAALLAGQAVDG